MTEAKFFEEVLAEDGSLFYKSTGVSMLPLIREGRDFIYIERRPEERLKKYDVVLFRRSGIKGRGSYVLHRILKVNSGGTYWIAGDNCTGGETIKEEDILGVLTLIKRKGRDVCVSDFLYTLYVKLWCAPYRFRFFILKCIKIPRLIAGKVLRAPGLR